MHDTNSQKPPEVFPDLATCCVKRVVADCFECLSVWASRCPHALSFGNGHYCHPATAREILARSEVKKDKPA
jgi:hypothetical protein